MSTRSCLFSGRPRRDSFLQCRKDMEGAGRQASAHDNNRLVRQRRGAGPVVNEPVFVGRRAEPMTRWCIGFSGQAVRRRSLEVYHSWCVHFRTMGLHGRRTLLPPQVPPVAATWGIHWSLGALSSPNAKEPILVVYIIATPFPASRPRGGLATDRMRCGAAPQESRIHAVEGAALVFSCSFSTYRRFFHAKRGAVHTYIDLSCELSAACLQEFWSASKKRALWVAHMSL
ncbi:hypothetical protein MSAN_01110000 [Mycena sanguinolenta]|uniref:Uncharacterized protein n=1 Tax=Mycena sanguinolenta TaxID=230812 RepID=A0A8H6YLB5_9AGAR|nr:hypothetical protein MSAN_01110000 [Mycena sanguinolenta]